MHTERVPEVVEPYLVEFGAPTGCLERALRPLVARNRGGEHRIRGPGWVSESMHREKLRERFRDWHAADAGLRIPT